MANCCSTFMKLIFLIIATLIGMTGILLTYIGTHKTLNVPLADFKDDKTTIKNLAGFIDCQDIADQKYKEASDLTGDEDIIKGMLAAQCMEPIQLPAGVIFNTAATLSMFSLISGIVAGCRDVKGNLYFYTVVSSASISLLIVSISWMAMISSGAFSSFAPCDAFDQATQEALEKNFGFQCVTFKDATNEEVDVATGWMTSVAVFYAGCVLSILSLLMFMLMNSCASSSSSTLQRETEKREGQQYARMDNTQSTGRY